MMPANSLGFIVPIEKQEFLCQDKIVKVARKNYDKFITPTVRVSTSINLEILDFEANFSISYLLKNTVSSAIRLK
jgi:hypothetical protein